MSDFAPDLVSYLQSHEFVLRDLNSVKGAAVDEEGTDFSEVLTAVAEADLGALRSIPLWPPQVEMLIRYRNDPDVVDAGQQGYRRLMGNLAIYQLAAPGTGLWPFTGP